MQEANIRNFAIIAHIDHGKSTLADRMLELTGTIDKNRIHLEQILDSNPIERERGITIKLAPVRMRYQLNDSEYIFNLIDTPGHVDFGYEVSRSLAACEGAVLLVDATQGVQAQTLANFYHAKAQNLTIIPVINKIDLQNAQVEKTKNELAALGFDKSEILAISAKTGQNVDLLLEAIAKKIPAPQGQNSKPLRALVFSSQYDEHKGVIVFVRVVDGAILFDSGLKGMASKAFFQPVEIGYFKPLMKVSSEIKTGEVGYIATGLKDIKKIKIGDTITMANVFDKGKITFGKAQTEQYRKKSAKKINNKTMNRFNNQTVLQPLAGYKEPKSMVFLSLFPIDTGHLQKAREAMEKLRLSDSSFTFKPISSAALGNGFHCGFLGLLHAEVVQERLSREFGLDMMATVPSVEYLIKLKNAKSKLLNSADKKGDLFRIQSAAEFPDPSVIDKVFEPVMELKIFSPKKYIGAVMKLLKDKRGEYMDLQYAGDQVQFTYLIPLSEMIVDFFDKLKGVSEGYASLDYNFFDQKQADIVRVDILVNKQRLDALSFLCVRPSAVVKAREIVKKLAVVIPRHQFKIPVQAAIGGKIIARADIKAFRKDVTAKLYGGDRTRKDKLLKKQKKGKAKMKMIGSVNIPQNAFLEVLKRE